MGDGRTLECILSQNSVANNVFFSVVDVVV